MAWHLQGTIFGQVMRFASGNRYFPYPDEIDPLLWKKATVQDTSDVTPEQIPAELGELEKEVDTEAQSDSSQKQEHRYNTEKAGKDNFLIVGWYGPEDPEVRAPNVFMRLFF